MPELTVRTFGKKVNSLQKMSMFESSHLVKMWFLTQNFLFQTFFLHFKMSVFDNLGRDLLENFNQLDFTRKSLPRMFFSYTSSIYFDIFFRFTWRDNDMVKRKKLYPALARCTYGELAGV